MRRLLALLLLLVPAVASAHSSSNSYLTIATDGPVLHVQWELSIRDLDDAIGIDSTGTGIVTWGVLKSREAAIADYARGRLALLSDDAACVPEGGVRQLVDQHGDGAYAVLRFDERCPTAPHHLGIRYTAFFDIDPQHRGLVNLVANGLSKAAVFAPSSEVQDFDMHFDLAGTFLAFFRAGIGHIMGGWDHLLFVAMLLCPVAFGRGDGRHAIRDTVAILTAFTAAHALSLSSVALGYVEVPQRLIEGAIALTIVATAVDNVVPFLGRSRWRVSFGFGLIHGLGFASSLGPLALPPLGLATALAAFNLGVEAAQLSVVAVVLPAGWLARWWKIPVAGMVPAASGAAALAAMAWFIGRTFGVGLSLY